MSPPRTADLDHAFSCTAGSPLRQLHARMAQALICLATNRKFASQDSLSPSEHVGKMAAKTFAVNGLSHHPCSITILVDSLSVSKLSNTFTAFQLYLMALSIVLSRSPREGLISTLSCIHSSGSTRVTCKHISLCLFLPSLFVQELSLLAASKQEWLTFIHYCMHFGGSTCWVRWTLGHM